MKPNELEQYLLQILIMTLGSIIQVGIIYTTSFTSQVKEDGFIFLSLLPSGYIIDNESPSKVLSLLCSTNNTKAGVL